MTKLPAGYEVQINDIDEATIVNEQGGESTQNPTPSSVVPIGVIAATVMDDGSIHSTVSNATQIKRRSRRVKADVADASQESCKPIEQTKGTSIAALEPQFISDSSPINPAPSESIIRPLDRLQERRKSAEETALDHLGTAYPTQEAEQKGAYPTSSGAEPAVKTTARDRLAATRRTLMELMGELPSDTKEGADALYQSVPRRSNNPDLEIGDLKIWIRWRHSELQESSAVNLLDAFAQVRPGSSVMESVRLQFNILQLVDFNEKCRELGRTNKMSIAELRDQNGDYLIKITRQAELMYKVEQVWIGNSGHPPSSNMFIVTDTSLSRIIDGCSSTLERYPLYETK